MRRLTVLQEKYTTRKEDQTSEPPEFVEKYEKLLATRKLVKDVEGSVKEYMKACAALSKSAKHVGASLETDAMTQADISTELNTKIESDQLVKSFSDKRQLLDDLVKQRKELEDLRLIRDHRGKKLVELQKLPESDKKRSEKEASSKQKLAQATKEYDDLLSELSKALDFVVTQSKDDPFGLIQSELVAFRATQRHFFDLLNNLFVGHTLGAPANGGASS